MSASALNASDAASLLAPSGDLPGSLRVDPRDCLVPAIGIMVVVAVYVGCALHFRRYINDDAYITFRVSRFVTLGRGPYFNVGEHVEGYTSPLFMLLMIPAVAWNAARAAAVAKAMGVLCGGLSLVAAAVAATLVWRADRPRLIVPGALVLAPALVAVSPSFAVNSVSGLETMLYTLLVSVGVALGTWAVQSGRWRGAGFVFAAAVVTRPEGALIFAVFWCALAVSAIPGRAFPKSIARQLIADAAIVTAVVAAHLVVRWFVYDHELLPNTYFAKAGGFWRVDAWTYIRDGALVPFGGGGAVVMACVGVLRLQPSAVRLILPIAAAGSVGAALPFVIGTDWMPGERLVVPYLPLLAAFVAVGWASALALVLRRPMWRTSVLLLIPAVLWYAQSDARAATAAYVNTRASGYENGHLALADWVTANAQSADTIALMDIGLIGYRCMDQRILDITGLTDRFIARSPGPFLQKDYDPGYVLRQKPRFIVLVLAAPGDPSVAVPKLDVTTWTGIEGRIASHPDFQREYVHPAPSPPDAFWLDRMAQQLGARKVFLHAYPGWYYFLAVFERRD